MNFVEYVSDRTDDAKSKEILNQALQQIHRIKKIVSNMLVFGAQQSRSNRQLPGARGYPAKLAAAGGELRKNGIQVEVDTADDLPAIRCSADSLQQILINLIINARDALADNRQPVIKIAARPIEGMLELSVTDNGPGIPQEIQTKIFDPFFTTKPPGKGTGLGLSVTRRLVQDVGGSIQVESLLEHGCCLRLQFPQA